MIKEITLTELNLLVEANNAREQVAKLMSQVRPNTFDQDVEKIFKTYIENGSPPEVERKKRVYVPLINDWIAKNKGMKPEFGTKWQAYAKNHGLELTKFATAHETVIINIDNSLFEASLLKVSDNKVLVELNSKIKNTKETNTAVTESKLSLQKYKIYIPAKNGNINITESKIWTIDK